MKLIYKYSVILCLVSLVGCANMGSTVLKKLNESDLSFIKNTLNTIKPFLKENQILSFEDLLLLTLQ